ncbi:hypothetical protein V8B97DRAFT_2008564 [Scleroderma yunnanense]
MGLKHSIHASPLNSSEIQLPSPLLNPSNLGPTSEIEDANEALLKDLLSMAKANNESASISSCTLSVTSPFTPPLLDGFSATYRGILREFLHNLQEDTIRAWTLLPDHKFFIQVLNYNGSNPSASHPHLVAQLQQAIEDITNFNASKEPSLFQDEDAMTMTIRTIWLQARVKANLTSLLQKFDPTFATEAWKPKAEDTIHNFSLFATIEFLDIKSSRGLPSPAFNIYTTSSTDNMVAWTHLKNYISSLLYTSTLNRTG